MDYSIRNPTSEIRNPLQDLMVVLPGVFPPLPIPNREVKPPMANGTAQKCGRVGSCHIHSNSLILIDGAFLCTELFWRTSKAICETYPSLILFINTSPLQFLTTNFPLSLISNRIYCFTRFYKNWNNAWIDHSTSRSYSQSVLYPASPQAPAAPSYPLIPFLTRVFLTSSPKPANLDCTEI